MKSLSELDHPALAVVGMACVFPKAGDCETYWANIRDGVDAITEVPEDTHWRPADYFDPDSNTPDKTYARRGAFIDPVDFDPLLYGISPNNLEATDTTQLLGMHVARMALRDADYASGQDADDGRPFDRSRCSVILGVTGTLELVIPLGARLGHPHWRRALQAAGVDKDTADTVIAHISDAYVPWQENSFPGLLGNVVAGRIANRFDLGGTNCVVDAACASSLSALHMAAMELYTGHCDMAITGGMDTFNDIFMYMCFSKTPALSPTGDSRPFSVNGDGTILGEGLGVVILKRLADAERDGDCVHAVIRGIGSASDGRGNAIYTPSVEGQTHCLRNAYQKAGVSPESIELLEGHGTGTRVGDAIEVSALSEVYGSAGNDRPWCALGSIKSMIGHTKAAAGVASLIKCVLALRHRVLPPTLKAEQALPQLTEKQAPLYLNTCKRPWINRSGRPRRAALSAFGFGGTNFHCVLEEYGKPPGRHNASSTLLFCYSAADGAGMDEHLRQLYTLAQSGDQWQELRRGALRSRQSFDPQLPHRLAFVLEAGHNAGERVGQIRAALHSGTDEPGPDMWYQQQPAQGKLALVFPGQGSQYVGMLRGLACQFPQCVEVLQGAEELLPGLSELIYPPLPKADAEETLRSTQYAQPALAASNIAALRVLRDFGVQADAYAGHSFGELCALHAAGRIDMQACLRLAIARGQAMHLEDGVHGGMAALMVSPEQAEQFIAQHALELTIANINAPEQIVVSGTKGQIEQCLLHCAEAGIHAGRLPVSGAFHSPLIAAALQPFKQALEQTRFATGKTPVYANSTAKPYPARGAQARKLLAEQLLSPVRFVAQIQRMYRDGIRCFVETGPDRRLAGLIRSILADRTGLCVCSLDASKGRHETQDLARLLGQLAVQGHLGQPQAWDSAADTLSADTAAARTTGMRIPVCGANYTRPKPEPERIETPAATPSGAGIKRHATTHSAPPSATAPVSGHNTGAKPATKPMTAPLPLAAQELNRQAILTLQQMQEHSVKLHHQYLLLQREAQQNMHQLLQQLHTGTSAPGATATTPPQSMPPLPEQHDIGLEDLTALPAAATTVASQPMPVPAEPADTRTNEKSHTSAPTADIDHLLLDIVSEKTGYPRAMLSLEMSLDTDLGIDSIKRVEILSALQERLPWAIQITPDEIGTFKFLQHIVEAIVATHPQPGAEQAAQPHATPVTGLAPRLLAIVADKTGYPTDMLELHMRLDEDLGIDSIKRVEILSAVQEQFPELPTLDAETLGSLQTLQQVLDRLAQSTASVPTATPPATGSTTGISAPLLLAIVADKTGYPANMLELHMRLDEDLGIDSIKRVEILSAVQEQFPELPALDAETLGSLQTLRQVLDRLAQSTAGTPTTTAAPPTAGSTGISAPRLLGIVADKTGYPADMLELHMRLDEDLGIDSIKRVEILSAVQEQFPELPALDAETLGSLQTLREVLDRLAQSETGGVASSSPNHTETATVPDEPTDKLQIHQVCCVPLTGKRQGRALPVRARIAICHRDSSLAQALGNALNAVTDAEVLLLEADPEALANVPPVDLLILLQAHGATLPAPLGLSLLQAGRKVLATNARLVGITCLGGQFGLDGLTPDSDAEQAALAGLIKTAALEWPETRCRIIDIATDTDAELLCQELLLDGPLETGLDQHGARTVALNRAQPLQTQRCNPPLSPGEIVVVTGGARGVSAAVAQRLAARWQVELHLLGRTPTEPADPDWAQGLEDEKALKQALRDHFPEHKPAELQHAYQQLMAQREIRANLDTMRAGGQTVHYHAVDVRDADAMARLMRQITERHGPVRGLVHGAGVLADRMLDEQTAAQFTSVWQTKVDGLRHLLAYCDPQELRFLSVFSSTTARFGRRGQGAYAAANEALNKLTLQQARQLPHCRCLALNWGPWAGGMVTPALRQLFASEGVGLIGLSEGADWLLDTLCVPATATELVIMAGDLPVQQQAATAYHDANVSASSEHSQQTLRAASRHILSLADYPCLDSHVMQGQAVLPVALILEWFGHAAIHNNPGLQFHGIADFYLCKGVRLAPETRYTLEVYTGELGLHTDCPTVAVELRAGDTLHARANVLLREEYPATPVPELKQLTGPLHWSQREYYSDGRLFHGHLLQGLELVSACDSTGIIGTAAAATAPETWMHNPGRSTWLGDPLVLDAAFQMLILWTEQHVDAPSLPVSIARYQQFRRNFPRTGTRIVARINEHHPHRVCADIEFIADDDQLVARILGYECICDAALWEAFRANQAIPERDPVPG